MAYKVESVLLAAKIMKTKICGSRITVCDFVNVGMTYGRSSGCSVIMYGPDRNDLHRSVHTGMQSRATERFVTRFQSGRWALGGRIHIACLTQCVGENTQQRIPRPVSHRGCTNPHLQSATPFSDLVIPEAGLSRIRCLDLARFAKVI
jgi:hypothetical protein